MAGTTEWKMSWKKATVWRTAVDTDEVLREVLFESENMPALMPEIIQDANVGDVLAQGIVQGNVSGEGTIVIPVRFEGVEYFIALFNGDDVVVAGGTDIGETAGTAVQHVMLFQASNTGKFGTLCIFKGGADRLWEYETAKISQIELNHANGKLMMTPTLIPNLCNRALGAGNAQASDNLASITAPSTSLLALFNQLTVRIKEVTGSEGNLSSTDDICVTNAQITMNRNLTGIPDSCGAGEVGEPETDGLPEAMLSLSLADYDDANDAFVKDAQTKQADGTSKIYKAQVFWEGKDIAGSDSTTGKGTGGVNIYEVACDLPAMQVMEGNPNAGSPGARTSFDLQFKLITPQTAGNGTEWTWVVAGSTPFRTRVINENAVEAD